jgi:dTDP-4-dehydrorhamnose reductase
MDRVLILGSKGMAGHLIKLFLHENTNFIIGEIARETNNAPNSFSIDVFNNDALDSAILKFAPDYVINCIGILNQDAESNPEKAIYLNSYLPHYLAKKGAVLNFKLIHISTDCVFSGAKGFYVETDKKDGTGFYAETKSLGEVCYGNNLTIRTSIIGPEVKNNGIGLLHWFLKNKDQSVKGFTNALWGGVTTLQLAKSIAEIMQNANYNGIFHLTNNERISKYDLLVFFNEVFQTNKTIIAEGNYRVDKSIRSDIKIENLSMVPNYHQMITELKIWMDDHEEVYSKMYKN